MSDENTTLAVLEQAYAKPVTNRAPKQVMKSWDGNYAKFKQRLKRLESIPPPKTKDTVHTYPSREEMKRLLEHNAIRWLEAPEYSSDTYAGIEQRKRRLKGSIT